jgi:hypothetical protein
MKVQNPAGAYNRGVLRLLLVELTGLLPDFQKLASGESRHLSTKSAREMLLGLPISYA